MRLYRYVSQRAGFQPRLAVAAPDSHPVDLLDAWNDVTGTRLDLDNAPTLASPLSLIEEGPEVWAEFADVARAAAPETTLRVDEGAPGFKWLCPLDRVSSLKDFLAFEDHVKLGAQRRGGDVPAYWYEAPVYYKGNHRSIFGPGDTCPWPSYSQHLDFELEMALVIGRRGRNLVRDKAANYVFGFTVFNDFSARDVQAKEISAWLGPAKGKDFANAFGPCVVTIDEVGPEPDLEMICRVNGDEWGRARTSDMHWRWADILAWVSKDEDVYPGDVLGSGTPGGCCGLDLNRRLEPGDVVELEIEKIGVLRNAIGRPGERRRS